ncbi:MAG: acetate--CoA ligase [Thermomicrobiales bacterium]
MRDVIANRPIRKNADRMPVKPNMSNYERERLGFSWAAAAKGLAGLPNGGINIAHEAVERHLDTAVAGRVALRWLSMSGEVRDFTYRDLSDQSNRVAHMLLQLGVAKGDRVFTLLGRVPELYLTALGAWKLGAVFCPLFSAFGPEPVHQRITRGDGKILVTSARLYRRRVLPIRDRLPSLEHILLVDVDTDEPGIHPFHALLANADDTPMMAQTRPEDMAILHFTSGTTGMPKGAVHVHEAVVAHNLTGRYALDLHPDDVFWCTADPGWVTGTSYGIISPLTVGVTNIIDESEFDAEHWYQTLQDQRVTVWYTAPTAIRMLMKAGPELPKRHDLSALRFIASVGEPLNPEAVIWGNEVLGLPIHDNWWQTETGGIMIANFASTDIRPGSMGLPLPGITAAIMQRRDDGTLREAIEGEEGELALRPGWPSMFRGYLYEEERYRKAFADGWYLTGDLARRDGDGYFWFVGRADDIIKSAGHLIGPFEVESALIEHEAVAEAAVIGKPDPVAGEIVKAFVALNPGFEATEAMERDLRGFARKRLGPAVAPREIEILETLPRTRSGKIMRRLLKARELGLPEGDTSTLERM